jgi:hypothetical protein
MKKIPLCLTWILCLIFSINQVASAQPKVSLCEDYTSAGQPIGANTEWTMKPTGGGVYILYNNNGVPISWPKLYVLIDREIDGEYREYATKSFAPDQSKSWAVFDFSFRDKGTFRVQMADEQMNPLAERIIEIKFEGDATDEEVLENASLTFCLGIDENENPVDISETFLISAEAGSYIYLYVDNGGEAMGTEGLIVDVWNGADYGDYVDTKNLTIEEQWTATYFKYTFTKAGEYKVMVYRKDNSLVVSGYVSIKYK